MHRVIWMVALLPACVLAGGTEGLDAKTAFLTARENLEKAEGFHILVEAEYAMGEMPGMKYKSEGVVKSPDLAYMKETQMETITTETYRKGSKLVTQDPTSGEWCDAAELGGGLALGNLQDPKVVLKLMDKSADTAEFAATEKVGDVECKKVVLKPKPEVLKDFLAAQGIPTLELDWSKGKIDFVTWVGVADANFYKIVLKGELEMAMPEGEEPAPGEDPLPPVKVVATLEVNLRNYGKDIDFEIPEKVKALLGL